MSACCTVASADNFFPGVKSLSSPPRFPKKGETVLEREEEGGRGRGGNALRGVGKFYVAGRVRGHRGSPSRGRDQKLSLGEDTTLTIRARAKQLRLPLLLLAGTLMKYVEKMRPAHGMITETFLDPSILLDDLNSPPLKGKIFLHAYIKDFDLRRLRIFGRKSSERV